MLQTTTTPGASFSRIKGRLCGLRAHAFAKFARLKDRRFRVFWRLAYYPRSNLDDKDNNDDSLALALDRRRRDDVRKQSESIRQLNDSTRSHAAAIYGRRRRQRRRNLN